MPLFRLDLLETLASGLDFRTGQRLADDHLLNHPDVIRALHWSVAALAGQPTRGKKEEVQENHDKPWSDEEDELLREGFAKALTLQDMAHAHGRTRGGIVARLKKHDLMR